MNGEIVKKIRCENCHSISVTIKQDIWGIHRVTCWNEQCKEESAFVGEVTIVTSGISKSESKMCYIGCTCEDCWPNKYVV